MMTLGAYEIELDVGLYFECHFGYFHKFYNPIFCYNLTNTQTPLVPCPMSNVAQLTDYITQIHDPRSVKLESMPQGLWLWGVLLL